MIEQNDILNIEIKARHSDLDDARNRLRKADARVEGNDKQVDTYFRIPDGRLKLREGNIERVLIHYHRADQEGPKPSEVSLMRLKSQQDCTVLRNILSAALGILVVVSKHREIYYLDNVKVHLDTLDELGTFIEIEAASARHSAAPERLEKQCRSVMRLLEITEEDLEAHSYSDLLLQT